MGLAPGHAVSGQLGAEASVLYPVPYALQKQAGPVLRQVLSGEREVAAGKQSLQGLPVPPERAASSHSGLRDADFPPAEPPRLWDGCHLRWWRKGLFKLGGAEGSFPFC